MTSLARAPLAPRPLAAPSPFKANRSVSGKRARSPDPMESSTIGVKRAKSMTPGHASRETTEQSLSRQNSVRAREESARDPTVKEREDRAEKTRLKAEREREFREKYSKAFPSWTFYFDTPEDMYRDQLAEGISSLGASVEEFFSRDVTHLIIPDRDTSNKENVHRSSQGKKGLALQSPKVKRDDSGLVKKAQDFRIKIWDTTKLHSVLNRCLLTSAVRGEVPSSQIDPRQLRRLLDIERLHGTTERDPTQKRHDYIYFMKNSCFMLIEDMMQELATIAAREYPLLRPEGSASSKSTAVTEAGDWPVLYLHPKARGPFIPYDEQAERKREKAEAAKREKERERQAHAEMLKRKERARQARAEQRAFQQQDRGARGGREPDLRRTVSMSNLHRAENLFDPDVEVVEAAAVNPSSLFPSARASGYLGSGVNVAASGNSVGITSTTGTTSMAGGVGDIRRVPVHLRPSVQKEVVTSKRAPSTVPGALLRERIRRDKGLMLPPPAPGKGLRKSKSTTTMRLPKREEGSKPGYCESCRMRFEDFRQHIEGKRHRRFAEEDSNFIELDMCLMRVARPTIAEVQEKAAMLFGQASVFATDIEVDAGTGLDAGVDMDDEQDVQVDMEDADERLDDDAQLDEDAQVDEDDEGGLDVEVDGSVDGVADADADADEDIQVDEEEITLDYTAGDDSYPIDLGSPLSELSNEDEDEDEEEANRAMIL